MTQEGILVGCLRPGSYFWSDDLGASWQPLDGVPAHESEVYQPWIQALPDGRIACAGHHGADNHFGELEQHVNLHTFRLELLRPTRGTKIDLVRDFDEERSRWLNAYTLRLSCDGEALAGKELEFWYVERDEPGHDSWNRTPLTERMEMGGQIIRTRTAADGSARIALPQLDRVESIHHTIQLVVRFNADRLDLQYRPAQTPQFEFYSNQAY